MATKKHIAAPRPFRPLLLLGMSGVAVCIGLSYALVKPLYSSTAALRYLPDGAAPASGLDKVLNTEIARLRSPVVINNAAQALSRGSAPGETQAIAKQLQQNIAIVRQGDMLRISATAAEPVAAEEAIRAIIQTYLLLHNPAESDDRVSVFAAMRTLKARYQDEVARVSSQLDAMTFDAAQRSKDIDYPTLVMMTYSAELSWRHARDAADEWKTLHPEKEIPPEMRDMADGARLRFDEATQRLNLASVQARDVRAMQQSIADSRRRIADLNDQLENLPGLQSTVGGLEVLSAGDGAVMGDNPRTWALQTSALFALIWSLGCAVAWIHRPGAASAGRHLSR